MKTKRWDENKLRLAAKDSFSIRQVLHKIKLKDAGGNYTQIKKYIAIFKIDTSHFSGQTWNKGLKLPFKPKIDLNDILVKNSYYQSYKLKKRLINEGLKQEKCEICGWSTKTEDNRIPLELDHVNGDRNDNRLKNLRVLCPNCHSLQPTHRGRNINKS